MTPSPPETHLTPPPLTSPTPTTYPYPITGNPLRHSTGPCEYDFVRPELQTRFSRQHKCDQIHRFSNPFRSQVTFIKILQSAFLRIIEF